MGIVGLVRKLLGLRRCQRCGCLLSQVEVEESFMNGYHKMLCDDCFDESVVR